MPIDVTVLTTRAECDEVLDSLEAELDGYQMRDSNLDFADRRQDRTQADVDGQLAGVDAEITAYTAILASPAITPRLRKQNETKLRKANDRKENLQDRGSARSPAARLLANVDTEQITAQVAVLTTAKDQVAAHRATLPA